MDSRIHPLVFDNYRLYISTLLFCCGVTLVCLPIHKIIDMRLLTQSVKFIGFQSEISLMAPTEEFTGLNDKTQLGLYSGYLRVWLKKGHGNRNGVGFHSMESMLGPRAMKKKRTNPGNQLHATRITLKTPLH